VSDEVGHGHHDDSGSNCENNVECEGVIGVRPPQSFTAFGISQWIGRLPTLTTSGSNTIVSANGTGLLGNKFMAGREADDTLPALTINSVAGLAEGGFIATDDGFLDGTQLTDRNEALIDIGAYLSVVGSSVPANKYPHLSINIQKHKPH